ncbi:MAG: DUF4012 domain-containing protein, partial [Candidatus Nanopelagicales bacterium]|nr:DUF4012 domain-containing protein [Candidatus Nanopelagicales bacterium]
MTIGTQLALVAGLVGGIQLGMAARSRDGGGLETGARIVQAGTGLLAAVWSAPTTQLLRWNPLMLGGVDDAAAAAETLDAAAGALPPLAQIGAAARGFDGEAPLIAGTTIDTDRLGDLAEPAAAAHASIAAARDAAFRVPGTGLLGRPIGWLADSVEPILTDVAELSGVLATAWPALPDALGATEPRRYLICGLNDAESFGSGGAPLYALMVEAVDGSLSVPISGQLESRLSPGNPPVRWDHAGGPPWYRTGASYPFVNSNFHPDFRTAAVDMDRAWAALGYPEVQGVLTIDVTALAGILAEVGPVVADGYGQVDADSLVRTVLVDAYQQFDSPEGVIERHARNDALVAALGEQLTDRGNLLAVLRGILAAVPPRHVQAAFLDPRLEEAVTQLGADGGLTDRPGDLLGVFSQNGPNKLTVFQERTIRQEVQLEADGGATVRRTVTFANAVPPGVTGDATTYRGYRALLARLRVAHRVPTAAQDLTISTGTARPLVPGELVGPYPDERGGKVLWQGHDTPPGEFTSVEVRYRLPAGTFAPGQYAVSVDPQALPLPVALDLRVSAPPSLQWAEQAGWQLVDGRFVWSGQLDRR